MIASKPTAVRRSGTRVSTSARRGARTFRAVLVAGAFALGLQACSSSTPLSNASLGLGYPGISMSGFKGEKPSDYEVHGIDVSKYQGTIDWDSVHRSGIEFAFLKATEGGDRLDDRFLENWREAKRAGVPRGAYHFWYHCRPGVEQADWFIRNVPNDPEALPPVIDVEWTPFSPTCTRRPPRDELISEVMAMADKLEAHYGKRPVLYIPIDVHRDRWVDATNSHEIWARAVADHPDNVYERRKFRFWQYTESGTVPGIRGGVDKNVFAGTRADWTNWRRHHTGV